MDQLDRLTAERYLPCSAIKDLLVVITPLLTTIAKFLGPGGLRLT